MKASNKTIKILTIITKIFFVWLLLQFFLQTFVTHRLGLDWIFWKMIWMRKEVIIIGLMMFLGLYFWKQKTPQNNWEEITPQEKHSHSLYSKNLKDFFEKFPLKTFVRVFLATIVVSFLVSVFINGSGIGTFIMSIRYSMIGFLIFIVFFSVTLLFFGTKEVQIIKRYVRIIKTLLVLSLCRWWIIWLMPNVLQLAGYNQFNYEWGVGIAPPAAYYTRFDQWWVRNQFVFERPISRWFFLVAFWPLFFVLLFKNKARGQKILRGSLYGLVVMSTFSRAALGVWILQTIILVSIQFPKKYWRKTLRWFFPLLLFFWVVTYFWRNQIITREFSNTGHIKHVVEGLKQIGERPLWWQWAGTAGPASHQVEGIASYNPENQYLQIWIEYGLLWFMGRIFLYGYFHRIAYKAYHDEKKAQDRYAKKRKFSATIVFAFGIGILWLSIEGLVLHSFVDRMIVYPFMALFAIAYGLYFREKSTNTK